MNTSELEQRMKQLLEEQEYAPTDASWQKMHEALHPPLAKRSSLLLLLPAWKMAAAIALLLTGSLGAYLFLKEEKKTAPAVAIQKVDPQQTAPATGPEENIADITETVPETTAGTHQPAIAIVPAAKNKLVHDTAVQAPHVAAQQDLQPAVVPGAQKPSPQNSLAQQEQQPSQQQRNYLPVFQHTPPDYERKTINLGLAANIGKPSLGNVQYNVGVVARKDIGSRIFAEANVSLASTQVNYSEKIASEVALSGVGDFSSESANPPREIMLNYSSNVIAVGVAPVIGLKATRNLSVSVGGDVYKTLNRNLDFKNSPDATLKNASVTPPAKVITDWDAGVKAQLDYRLGKRLSMNTQYRQGLTQYILVNGNKPIRNSIFNLGFKYYIGK